MKKSLLVALVASAAFATPAAAQSVTGTITLTGTVGNKCFVSPSNGTTFSATEDFEQLDAADGTLRSGLATEFGTKSFTVKCTTSNPKISVEASPLATAGTAAAGYDNSIDYSATVTVDKAGGGIKAVTDLTSAAGATVDTVGAPLANSASNVNITTTSYATDTATSLLVAGTYTGTITVVISPV